MTKKAPLLLFFFMMYIFVSPPSMACFIAQDKAKDIPLRGELYEKQIPRSLIIPIKVTLLSNSILELQFYFPLANLNISISKEGKVIEQRTLSIYSSQIESFDLDGLDSGGYVLTLSTPQGTFLFGDFVVE